MSGRLSKTKALLIKGRCLNYACDVRLYCGLYDKNPTTKEKENYPAMSMEQCPLFADNNPPIPRDKEPTRPFMEAYGGGNKV